MTNCVITYTKHLSQTIPNNNGINNKNLSKLMDMLGPPIPDTEQQ